MTKIGPTKVCSSYYVNRSLKLVLKLDSVTYYVVERLASNKYAL